MFILFAVQCGLISPILLLYVEFCFPSQADKVVREQGAQQRVCPERYYERQTESNRLQGERSAGRTKTERNKQETEKSMSGSRKSLQNKTDEHLPLRGTNVII